jgi:hypothetical protein
MLTKCTVQEAKSPVNISSDSVAWRDLIPVLKGYIMRDTNKALIMSMPSYQSNTLQGPLSQNVRSFDYIVGD